MNFRGFTAIWRLLDKNIARRSRKVFISTALNFRPISCAHFHNAHAATFSNISQPCISAHRLFSTRKQPAESSTDDSNTVEKDEAPLGLVARFKKMYKEYWYVLVPAHVVTSVMWFGGFYYMAVSGFDVVGLLESWSFNEAIIKPFRDSGLGHVAVAYLLYKIATPARYTVTLGTTTFAIKYLVRWGIIKPVPSKAQLIQMYQDKKQNLQDVVADKKVELQQRRQNLMQDISQFKEEFHTGVKAEQGDQKELKDSSQIERKPESLSQNVKQKVKN